MFALTIDTIHDAGDFKSKMPRKEFWMWQLFSRLWLVIIALVLGFVAFLTSSPGAMEGLLPALILVAVAEPGAATRRLKDIGKSGWFQLIPFYNIYLFLQPSK